MLEKRIKQNFETFSSGQKLMAEKILYHPEIYTMLSITECSKKLGVSDASLSRFVRALDFNSYNEFQNFLKSQLISQFSPKTKMERALEKQATKTNRIYSELQKDIESLSFALQTIEVDQFEHAVSLLANAQCIYIVGLGISKSLVSFLEFRLRRIGIEQKALIVGGHELLERLVSI